jgi:hypothetical protein
MQARTRGLASTGLNVPSRQTQRTRASSGCAVQCALCSHRRPSGSRTSYRRCLSAWWSSSCPCGPPRRHRASRARTRQGRGCGRGCERGHKSSVCSSCNVPTCWGHIAAVDQRDSRSCGLAPSWRSPFRTASVARLSHTHMRACTPGMGASLAATPAIHEGGRWANAFRVQHARHPTDGSCGASFMRAVTSLLPLRA